jgi:hypothetical protein
LKQTLHHLNSIGCDDAAVELEPAA